MDTKGKKVFVGLSGGVDSAVSAALLKKQGYDVTGVFIKVWAPDFLPCTWREERRDAMRVALALDIPFLFLDLTEEYKKGVADMMIEEYKRGRTPNPDVLCNREVKFGAFWREAQSRGADYIATGHYIRLAEDTARKTTEVFSAENLPDSRADALRDAFSSQYLLLAGRDSDKDQSYFLWTLTQEDLAHTLFPVGGLEKKEVRRLAERFGLPVAEKKDSQGICFLGDVDIEEFLSHFMKMERGKVLNTEGEVIGEHSGAIYYTVGQRHGFDIHKKAPEAGAFYVVGKDLDKNTITVSNNARQISARGARKVRLTNANWVGGEESVKSSAFDKVEARIRYRGQKIPCKLFVDTRCPREIEVEFESAQTVALGQSIVFYDEDVLLGGAVMDEVVL